jgi:SAM-dependent methyltransferase
VLEAEKRAFFASPRRRVLDVAPIARARDLFPSREIGYFSFDLLSPLANVRGDLTRAPFADASFDFVLCCHVLEHIRDEGGALRELRRMLRPGGLGVLQVPWDPALAATREYPSPRPEEEGHVRRYGKDLPERWRRAGFVTEFSDLALRLPTEQVAWNGLERDVVMFVR